MWKIKKYDEQLGMWTELTHIQPEVLKSKSLAEREFHSWQEQYPNARFWLQQAEPVLELLTEDIRGDNESWSRVWILKWSGTEPMNNEDKDDNEEDENAILNACCTGKIMIRSIGNGVPGQPFAHEPYIRVLKTGYIIVEQSGGLDI